jgi:hypothetical protein
LAQKRWQQVKCASKCVPDRSRQSTIDNRENASPPGRACPAGRPAPARLRHSGGRMNIRSDGGGTTDTEAKEHLRAKSIVGDAALNTNNGVTKEVITIVRMIRIIPAPSVPARACHQCSIPAPPNRKKTQPILKCPILPPVKCNESRFSPFIASLIPGKRKFNRLIGNEKRF